MVAVPRNFWGSRVDLPNIRTDDFILIFIWFPCLLVPCGFMVDAFAQTTKTIIEKIKETKAYAIYIGKG